MRFRTTRRIQHLLERFVVRGALAQLSLIAIFIISISFLFGFLESSLDHPQPKTAYESTWWAFLRLTDPGYLGDDDGLLRRVYSTILTILGYVLFMGSLVAILTQWLNQTMRNLEKGLTPIVRDHHILVAGSGDTAELVVKALFESYGRTQRFFERRGTGQLHIVLLSEHAGSELRLRLKRGLGAHWNSKKFTMRAGTAWNYENLERVDFTHASVVILPSERDLSARHADPDDKAIKTLLSMSCAPTERGLHDLPAMVIEVANKMKLESIEASYRGPVFAVPTNHLIALLLRQNLREPGIMEVFNQLIRHDDGNEIYLRDGADFEGLIFAEISHAHSSAIPIGVISTHHGSRTFQISKAEPITRDDILVLIAPSFEKTLIPQQQDLGPRNDQPIAHLNQALLSEQNPIGDVLILGWNQRGPALLEELSRPSSRASRIHISTQRPVELDAKYHEQEGATITPVLHKLDNAIPANLRSIQPQTFDHVVVLSSEWLGDEDRADARAISTLVALAQILPSRRFERPHIALELLEPSNATLAGNRVDDVLVSPELMSQILSQVALRPDIKLVYDALFTCFGPSFTFRSAQDYGLPSAQELEFSELQDIASSYKEIAIGVYRPAKAENSIVLNPPRSELVCLSSNTLLVVLTDLRTSSEKR